MTINQASRPIMTNLAQLKFFATQPHTCSYLPDERATTLFLDPQQSIDLGTYSRLSDLGFRRSGDHLYRPHCEQCNACIPVRISVARFTPNKQQRRILRRNQDIQILERQASFNAEHYVLFARYIEQRHADGDMYPPSRDQFESFLVREHSFTRFFEYRLDDELIAVAVTDIMENGLSAVYTFFAPEHERRSLGRFAILWQIEEARRRGLPSLYLGYWIKECRKMNYKTEYRPLEMLVNQRWIAI